jgi:hypothetical protein
MRYRSLRWHIIHTVLGFICVCVGAFLIDVRVGCIAVGVYQLYLAHICDPTV